MICESKTDKKVSHFDKVTKKVLATFQSYITHKHSSVTPWIDKHNQIQSDIITVEPHYKEVGYNKTLL